MPLLTAGLAPSPQALVHLLGGERCGELTVASNVVS